MKKQAQLLTWRARRFVGAAFLLSLLGFPAAAQCGDDFYVDPGLTYQYYNGNV